MREKDTARDAIAIPGWVAILVAIGIALDILIGVALGAIALQARDASSSAHIARVSAYEACLKANDYRKADLARWRAIITLLRSGPDTPQLQRFIAGVNKANGTADQSVDCGKLTP